MTLKKRVNYGWLPDLPDFRDKLAFPEKAGIAATAASVPQRVDLRERHVFVVNDQGYLGSCVAHAVSSAIEYAKHTRENDPKVSDFLEQDRQFPVSRLFLYYEARRPIDMIAEDSGCYIRDAMRVAYNIGVPRETGWRYHEDAFAVAPPARSYKSAPYHKITSYKSVAVDNNEIRLALSQGHPVVFGISVFDSFYNERNGVVPMPTFNDEYLGGHSMLIVGYDDRSKLYTVLNSWGNTWGDDGFCYIPYSYIGNRQLGSDYWLLTDELYKERM
jgi:Cysteine protease